MNYIYYSKLYFSSLFLLVVNTARQSTLQVMMHTELYIRDCWLVHVVGNRSDEEHCTEESLRGKRSAAVLVFQRSNQQLRCHCQHHPGY